MANQSTFILNVSSASTAGLDLNHSRFDLNQSQDVPNVLTESNVELVVKISLKSKAKPWQKMEMRECDSIAISTGMKHLLPSASIARHQFSENILLPLVNTGITVISSALNAAILSKRGKLTSRRMDTPGV
jgi:folate-dependent tRNA-U54 methylase TrmFO/GidA